MADDAEATDDKGPPFMYFNVGHFSIIVTVLASVFAAYTGITNGLAVHTEQITTVKTDIGSVKAEISGVKDDLGRLQKDFSFMAGRLGMDRRGDNGRMLEHGDAAPPPPLLAPG